MVIKIKLGQEELDSLNSSTPLYLSCDGYDIQVQLSLHENPTEKKKMEIVSRPLTVREMYGM